VEGASFGENWHPVSEAGDCGVRMIRNTTEGVKSALLYIHRFRFIAPYKLKDAQDFARQYGDYDNITDVPDRLRWCRYSAGLLQTEVAEIIGISESIYKALEKGITQHLPRDVAERLAQLYRLPVTDFIDEYNLFLCDGQAQRIRAYRAKLGMKRKPFARALGIPIRSLQAWESETKVISRKCWERYFKGKA